MRLFLSLTIFARSVGAHRRRVLHLCIQIVSLQNSYRGFLVDVLRALFDRRADDVQRILRRM